VSLQNRFKSLHYNSPVILTMTLLSLGALILQNITRGYTTSLLFSVYRSSPSVYFSISGFLDTCWDMQTGSIT